MELRQYAQLVRKWLWLIVVCTLAAGGAAYFISKNSTPIYQASATLLVSQASNPTNATGYAEVLTSERLARTYASLLTGWPVLEATASQLGVRPEVLRGVVTVTPVRDTQLLTVKVEGPDARLAAEIANTLPSVFIGQNQKQLMSRVSESKASLEREITSVEDDIARTQTTLQTASDDAQKIRLETSLAQYRSTYSNLVASYQQIKLAEAQATDNIVMAEPAQVPRSSIRPRIATNTLLAMVIGALLAVSVAFLIEYLDDTIKTPDDIDRLTGLSTLGAIARFRDTGAPRQLIAWLNTQAPETEAYRVLRTNIQFSSVDKPIRTLLVTSPSPSEGKSTTAANLAAVMAQTGQKVILVDTDLRRPVMHKVIGVPNNTGLTTAMLENAPITLSDHLSPTQVENLSVLTSGPIPPNPSELLGSHRMASLIEQLSQQADLVIFDSPPVLAVTDAAVLGRQVDGVLLVADAGQTREQALAHAAQELRKTGANLLGVALNRLDTRRGGYYYYYYYYYYSGDEHGEKRRRTSSRNGGDDGQEPKKELVRLPWQRK
ncbi:MAG: polysaccharide biosynthesis tyrosine autokinase [Chloroflexi bacterium]|nr:polysaccharide biosynthesis tyrosine autokinase [Chloroflexota bacterium]